MTFTFKPALYTGSTFYELPRPITTLRIQDSWDFEQFKVPLADGDTLVGHSRQGIDMSVAGQLGTQAGGLKISEADMFQELEELRSYLDVTSGGDQYEFFLYHDTTTATYRHQQPPPTTITATTTTPTLPPPPQHQHLPPPPSP